MSPNPEQLLALAAVWALWCLLHSLPLWEPLRRRLEARLGVSPRRYRGLYSIFSLLSLAPVMVYYHHLDGVGPFLWPWPWWVPQAVLWLLAAALMLWADRSFKRVGFDLMGLGGAGTESEPPLVTSGAYARLRHPMHLAGLVMLWARSLGAADVVTNLVLSAYLVLGCFIEESRLKRRFGRRYRDYARRVPILGWRWRV